MPLATEMARLPIARPLVVALLAIVSGLGPGFHRLAWADSSISDLRREVREPDPPSRLPTSEPEPAPSSRDHCDYDDDCGDGFGLYALAGYGLLYVAMTPYTVPKSMIERHSAHLARFADYPYAENDGFMVLDGQLTGSNTWAGRFSAEYGTEFSTKDWVAGRWLVEHTSRFGVDGAVVYLSEKTNLGATDEFFYGDTNLTWRFAQNEWAQMRMGLGLNWLGDGAGEDVGFNFTYGGDFFPMEPLVVSGELDIGSLNHAFLLHARGTVGVQMNRMELFTGYDYLQLDSSNVHGLVAGVRLWF